MIEIMNLPQIIDEFSIDYEKTAQKSFHDVTTPMED